MFSRIDYMFMAVLSWFTALKHDMALMANPSKAKAEEAEIWHDRVTEYFALAKEP